MKVKTLDLISSDDLIKELEERFEHFVFSGMRTKVGKYSITSYRRWNGNDTTCLGLCSELQHDINVDSSKNLEDIKE